MSDRFVYVHRVFAVDMALCTFYFQCHQLYQCTMEVSAANLQLLSTYLQKTLSSDHAERRSGLYTDSNKFNWYAKFIWHYIIAKFCLIICID